MEGNPWLFGVIDGHSVEAFGCMKPGCFQCPRLPEPSPPALSTASALVYAVESRRSRLATWSWRCMGLGVSPGIKIVSIFSRKSTWFYIWRCWLVHGKCKSIGLLYMKMVQKHIVLGSWCSSKLEPMCLSKLRSCLWNMSCHSDPSEFAFA